MFLSLLHIVPCFQEQFADLLLPFIMALLLVTVLEPVKQALVGAGGRWWALVGAALETSGDCISCMREHLITCR